MEGDERRLKVHKTDLPPVPASVTDAEVAYKAILRRTTLVVPESGARREQLTDAEVAHEAVLVRRPRWNHVCRSRQRRLQGAGS